MRHTGTQLDSVAALTDQARATVRAYLVRTGNSDLLEVLGLTDPPVTVAAPIVVCPICRNLAPKHGVCRRSRQCRAEAERKAS